MSKIVGDKKSGRNGIRKTEERKGEKKREERGEKPTDSEHDQEPLFQPLYMSLNVASGPCRVVLCSFCHYRYYQYLLSTKYLIKAFEWSQEVFRNDSLMWQVLQLFQGRAKMCIFTCGMYVSVFKSLLVELLYHQNYFIRGRGDCSRVPNLFLLISHLINRCLSSLWTDFSKEYAVKPMLRILLYVFLTSLWKSFTWGRRSVAFYVPLCNWGEDDA